MICLTVGIIIEKQARLFRVRQQGGRLYHYIWQWVNNEYNITVYIKCSKSKDLKVVIESL